MRLVDVVRACSFVEVRDHRPGLVRCGLAFLASVECTVARLDNALSVEGAIGEARGGLGGTLDLKPERGLAGVAASLAEIKLDDPVVDAAWIIHGDDAPLLLAAVPELQRLAAPTSGGAPRIGVRDGRLSVQWSAITDDHVAVAVEAALSLWHRAAFHRAA